MGDGEVRDGRVGRDVREGVGGVREGVGCVRRDVWGM